jgi:hypothetical protein
MSATPKRQFKRIGKWTIGLGKGDFAMVEKSSITLQQFKRMTLPQLREAAGRLTIEARREISAEIEQIRATQDVDLKTIQTYQLRIREIDSDLTDHTRVIEAETFALMEWSAERAALELKINALGTRRKGFQDQIEKLVHQLSRDNDPIGFSDVSNVGQRSISAGPWPPRAAEGL